MDEKSFTGSTGRQVLKELNVQPSMVIAKSPQRRASIESADGAVSNKFGLTSNANATKSAANNIDDNNGAGTLLNSLPDVAANNVELPNVVPVSEVGNVGFPDICDLADNFNKIKLDETLATDQTNTNLLSVHGDPNLSQSSDDENYVECNNTLTLSELQSNAQKDVVQPINHVEITVDEPSEYTSIHSEHESRNETFDAQNLELNSTIDISSHVTSTTLPINETIQQTNSNNHDDNVVFKENDIMTESQMQNYTILPGELKFDDTQIIEHLNETVDVPQNAALNFDETEIIEPLNETVDVPRNETINDIVSSGSLKFDETAIIETVDEHSSNLNDTIKISSEDLEFVNEYEIDEDINAELNASVEVICEEKCEVGNNSVQISTPSETPDLLIENTNVINDNPVILNETISCEKIDNLVNQPISSCDNEPTIITTNCDVPQNLENTFVAAVNLNTNENEVIPIPSINETINIIDENAKNDNFECEISCIANLSDGKKIENVNETQQINDETEVIVTESNSQSVTIEPSTSTPISAVQSINNPRNIICTKHKIVILSQTNNNDTTLTDNDDDVSENFPTRRLSIRQDLFPTSSDSMLPFDCENGTVEEVIQEKMSTASELTHVSKKCSEFSDLTFKKPKAPAAQTINAPADLENFAAMQANQQDFGDEEFSSAGTILKSSDFDFLLTKGESKHRVDTRCSLLLRFDPLCSDVTSNRQSIIASNISTTNNNSKQQPKSIPNLIDDSSALANVNTSSDRPVLSKSTDENEFISETLPIPELEQNSGPNSSAEDSNNTTIAVAPTKEHQQRLLAQQQPLLSFDSPTLIKSDSGINNQQKPGALTTNATFNFSADNANMSVGLIKDMKPETDGQHFNQQANEKSEIAAHCQNADEVIERKFKHESIKTEDYERKIREMEVKQEALLKRITEKDKNLNKMLGVMEAYEKAIAELVAEKERVTVDYERKTAEVIAEKDLNSRHLSSLETTFSDLISKYEKSKETIFQLQESQEKLCTDNKVICEQLGLQEQRYDKMKSHAMQQLEIANTKLESLNKCHAVIITRLKASLKKEEVSKQSMAEQLNQKTKENAELVKICDELIGGQSSS